MKNILVICRSVNDLALVSKKNFDQKQNHILCSNDILVHRQAQNIKWVKKVCFIDNLDSLHTVAVDVIRILNVINNWFSYYEQYTSSKENKLLYWVKHCEGGMTTQRIQDLLLYIDTYNSLIRNYKIDNVKILFNNNLDWENRIVMKIAESLKIDVELVKGNFFTKTLSFNEIKTNPYFRETYNLCNIAFIKIFKKLNYILKNKNEIIFRLCGDQNKHLINSIPMLQSLKKNGFNPLPLIWGSRKNHVKVNGQALSIYQLEKSLSWTDYILSIIRSVRIWRKIKRGKSSFYEDQNLKYKNILLGPLLWESIRYFSLAEVGNRLRFIHSVRSLLKNHNPIAVKFCTVVQPEDSYLHDIVNKSRKIINIWWPIYPHSQFQPYDHQKIPIDIAFAISDFHKKWLKSKKYNIKKTGIIGEFIKNDNLGRKNINKDDSRQILNIPKKYSNFILLEAGYVLRGISGAYEQTLAINCIIKLAKKYSEKGFLIKPHPAHKYGNLDILLANHKLKNLFLIDKSELPFHAINVSDLIITKMSGIAYDAMYLKKPVISLNLTRDEEFNSYFDAARYIYDIDELTILLNKFLSEDSFKEHFTNQLNYKSKLLLKNFRSNEQKSPYELASKIIKDFRI